MGEGYQREVKVVKKKKKNLDKEPMTHNSRPTLTPNICIWLKCPDLASVIRFNGR